MDRFVLLPGLDGSGQLFSPFLTVLPPHIQCQVIAYPPNQCCSYAEVVDYVMPRLPAHNDFCLIAESFSGPAAIDIARQTPPGLKGVVLVASFCHAPLSPFMRDVIQSFLGLLRLAPPASLINYFLCNGSQVLLSRDVQRCVSSLPFATLKGRVQSALQVDLRGGLDEVEVPLLALTARQDRLLQKGCAATMVRFHSKLQVKAIDGPHFLLQCRPQQSWGAMEKFLSQTSQKNSS